MKYAIINMKGNTADQKKRLQVESKKWTLEFFTFMHGKRKDGYVYS